MANNIVGNAPNAVVAKSTISFVDAGITSVNTEIIFKVDAALQSYKPGRAINGISGFVANAGYYFVAKQDMDLTAVLVPPLSGITQLNTPTNFTATPTSTTQINLAWDAVASATGYVVDRATNSGFTTGVALGIYNSSGTSYNNTGLTASTTYYYRVRAIAAGYTDSNYGTASGTTQTAGGTVEDIVWEQLTLATNSGAGDLTATGGTPAGGTATKKLSKVNGNYVQQTVQSSPLDTATAVLLVCAANDADYRWSNPDNEVLASVYNFGGSLNTTTGPTNSSATGLGAIADGNIIRLEVSGDDVLVKKSTNGGSSYTTLHTHTGVLTGITDIFVKGLLATGGGGVNHAEGLGLVTI
jgi:hypothetical protein